jgi:hypothetical protein
LVLLIAVSTRFRLVGRGDDPDRRLKFWGLTKLGKHGAMAVNLLRDGPIPVQGRKKQINNKFL